MKFNLLPQTAGLLKLFLNSVCTSSVQGRKLCWRDFIKHTLDIVMCQDTCEPICLHVVCTRLGLSHLSVRVGDSSRRSVDIVKNLELRLSMLLLLLLLTSSSLSLLLLLLLQCIIKWLWFGFFVVFFCFFVCLFVFCCCLFGCFLFVCLFVFFFL